MEKIKNTTTKMKKQIKKKTTKLRKRITMKPKTQTTVYKASNYRAAILRPETAFGARVPFSWNTKTVTLHRHISQVFTTNAVGAASVIYDPYFLAENGTALRSTLWINNDVLFTGNNTLGNSVAINLDYSLPVSNVQGYRLVSACCHLLPQSSLLTASGKITAALVKSAGLTPAAVGALLNFSNLSVPLLNQESYMVTADICQQQAARVIWLPLDGDFFEILNVNNALSADGVNHPANLFSFIITGAPTQQFTLEIYLNYEVTSTPGSILVGTEETSDSIEQPQVILIPLAKTPELVCQAFASHSELENVSTNGISKLSIAKNKGGPRSINIPRP
jgi:hypothetical protein